MREVSRARRVGVSALLIVIPAAVMALVFSEPGTASTTLQVFLIVVTAPFQGGWWMMRLTGPVRLTIVRILFVALPVLLLPAYAVKPRTSTAVLTAVGAMLWLVSGLLMVALRFVD